MWIQEEVKVFDSKNVTTSKVQKFPTDFLEYAVQMKTYKQESGTRAIIYGADGTCKSYFGGCAPAPVVFFNYEDSTKRIIPEMKKLGRDELISLVDLYEEDLINNRDNIKSLDRTEAALCALIEYRKQGGEVNTLVFDFYSFLWTCVGDWNHKVHEDKGDLTKIGKVSQFNWAPANERIKRLTFRAFANVPNVILICHEKEVQNKDQFGNKLPNTYRPAAPPRASNWVDYIIRSQKIGQPDGSVEYIATVEKAGISKLTKRATIKDITFGRFIECMKSEYGVEETIVGGDYV